jgi:DNA-binding NarL/FixJ family response regulator
MVSRVLVVDDHPIVRQGFLQLIGGTPDLEVCGEARGLGEAMRAFHNFHPHLITADILLDNGTGLELTKELTALDRNAQVLICSMHDEALYAERALRAGAKGYISKTEPADVILSAMRRVLGGRIYLSPRMTERMLSRTTGHDDGLAGSPVDSLSDRELEVFEAIGHGLSTKQIAAKLELSPKTIETYRENIKQKLGLRNATELTQHAVRWVLEHS